jgi:hypothetical protein
LIFHQTELLEIQLYKLCGVLIALIPIFFKLFLRTESTPIVFKKYTLILGVILAAVLAHKTNAIGAFFDPAHALKLWTVFFFMLASLLWTPFFKLRSKSTCLLFFSVFVGLVLLLNFSTAFYAVPDSLTMNERGGPWHHWGAYISSAKSLKSGLAIHRDFPSQYGLGPSLMIALLSKFGWVTATFLTVGINQVLFWLCLSVIGLFFAKLRFGYNPLIWLCTLFTVTAACQFSGVVAFGNLFPSLGGTRFFPATLLVTFLIVFDINRENLNRKNLFIIHGLWTFGLFWSIESAFYDSLIWWPYFLMLKFPDTGTLRQKLLAAVRACLLLLAQALGSLAILLVIYASVYSTLPILDVYTAFATNVPGAMLISFYGRFIFVLGIFIFTIFSLFTIYKKERDSALFRQLFVLLLLSYGGFSYYIGRSHDLNLLILLPYFVLILLALCFTKISYFIRSFSVCALVFIVPHLIPSPKYNVYIRPENIFHFEAFNLDKMFINVFENPETSDRGRAIHDIVESTGEPVLAIDSISTVVLSGSSSDWSSYNNDASYAMLPIETQKKFVRRSHQKLMRSGWIVLEKAISESALPRMRLVFDDFYIWDEQRDFGGYISYHLTPKPL